jgi:hypothetical protein
MSIRHLIFTFALPAILMAQPSMQERIKNAEMIVTVEREAWKQACAALELGPQGIHEAIEVEDWAFRATEIEDGKPITPAVREYLVKRWKARHQAITLRYTIAFNEANMRATFPARGWAKYKEWQTMVASFIQAIDAGKMGF